MSSASFALKRERNNAAKPYRTGVGSDRHVRDGRRRVSGGGGATFSIMRSADCVNRSLFPAMSCALITTFSSVPSRYGVRHSERRLIPVFHVRDQRDRLGALFSCDCENRLCVRDVQRLVRAEQERNHTANPYRTGVGGDHDVRDGRRRSVRRTGVYFNDKIEACPALDIVGPLRYPTAWRRW